MTLSELGLDTMFLDTVSEYSARGFGVARIISESRGLYTVRDEEREVPAETTGRFMFTLEDGESLPAVGDWVAVIIVDDGTRAIIHELLPRTSSIVRKEAGKRVRSQVIAANVDTAFIVQGLDGNFNERRLERYCVVVKSGGVAPVVLLSKSDLVTPDELDDYINRAQAVVPGVPVHPYSVFEGGFETVHRYITVGSTVCLIGSSGVGKSTLINALVGGDVQVVSDVRKYDAKGRHTTARRDMLFIDGGGMLIDTPGMRELALWGEVGVDDAFPEIAVLRDGCRFRDCTHTSEPGCAVRAAVDEGTISEQRYESYLKLLKEAGYIEAKKNDGVRAAKKKREKHYKKWAKESYRLKGKL